jgi:hypothetical protein
MCDLSSAHGQPDLILKAPASLQHDPMPKKEKKNNRPWVYRELNNSHSFTKRSASKKEGMVQTGGSHSGKFEHTIE